jgi:hypothetical protein
MRVGKAFALASAVALASACVLPTDRSGGLRVELDPLPTLLLKDSLRLAPRVLDSSGVEVPQAALAFSSSNPTVFIVDAEGLLRAVGVGTATLEVTAVGFERATPYTQVLRVRGKLEVDSIRPDSARFGDSIEVFGVGLDPDSLFSISIGGTDAEVSAFLPQDPGRPDREAMLRVWVPPPAPRRSAMTLLGFGGGVVLPDTIDVAQRDLFEPNDTVPHGLGSLPNGFRNPALALEPRVRAPGDVADERQPADWFTFDNPAAQDRTIVFVSEGGLGQAFGVALADSLEWSGATRNYVAPGSWTAGIGTYLCGGLAITRPGGEPAQIDEVLFPLSIVAVRNLPAGRFHVLVPYVPFGTPTRYELLILNGYTSILPPDAAEENDYCDVATPINPAGPVTATLTVDNPHDVDWFRFTAPLLGLALTASVTAQHAEADLDLYLVRDFRPDSLVLVAAATGPGTTDGFELPLLLPQGDYFLLVVDFQGQPTAYTLSSAAATGAAAGRTGGPAVRRTGGPIRSAFHPPVRPPVAPAVRRSAGPPVRR